MVSEWVDLLVFVVVCGCEVGWVDVVFFSEFEEGEGGFVTGYPGIDSSGWG